MNSLFDGHLAIMNNAAMDIRIPVVVWACVFNFLVSVPRSRITVSRNSIFKLLGNCQDCFPKFLYNFIFPPALYEDSNFTISSPAFAFFHFSYCNGCDVVFLCDFSLHLPDCSFIPRLCPRSTGSESLRIWVWRNL